MLEESLKIFEDDFEQPLKMFQKLLKESLKELPKKYMTYFLAEITMPTLVNNFADHMDFVGCLNHEVKHW